MYFSEKIRSVYDPVIENLLQLLTAAVAQVFGVGERRRCRDYGDFAAGSGVDVVGRGGSDLVLWPVADATAGDRGVRLLRCCGHDAYP